MLEYRLLKPAKCCMYVSSCTFPVQFLSCTSNVVCLVTSPADVTIQVVKIIFFRYIQCVEYVTPYMLRHVLQGFLDLDSVYTNGTNFMCQYSGWVWIFNRLLLWIVVVLFKVNVGSIKMQWMCVKVWICPLLFWLLLLVLLWIICRNICLLEKW